MEITLEQVERLQEKAGVSYSLAKRALEFSGGNLLDALIYLEEKGYILRPEGGNLSTRASAPPPPDGEGEEPAQTQEKGTGGHSPLEWIKRLGLGLVDNELELWRKGKLFASVPVLIPLVLLICFPWLVLPILIVALFFGVRYRFSGPDLEREDLNGIMGSMADGAADVGRKVMDEISAQQKKHDTKPPGEDSSEE